MAEFSVAYSGLRLVQTHHGDSLRAVAARELGDPSRWYELVFLNNLVAPYLTDDPAQVGTGVLLNGSRIQVPATADYVPATVDPEAVFGADLRLTRGELTVTDGDLDLVAGAPNLTQAMRHVLATEIGEVMYHPAYGNGARGLLGRANNAGHLLLADSLVRRAILSDDRVQSIRSSRTAITGDVLSAEVVAEAVNGVTVRVPA